MAADAARAYGEVPYPGHAFSQTHPSRLHAIARLHGLDPAPPQRCRVLEIGCGDGGNLLPMAWEFPASRFTGVDLAPAPVARGIERARALDLANVDLRVADVRALGGGDGTFDYVIAHGIYSWVPADVREAILATCAARLAPHGVAFVSYNALPGGHFRLMLREMLLHHVSGFAEPRERIRQAAGLLRLLASERRPGDPVAALFMEAIENSSGMAEASLYHDLLGPENAHFHFHEFMADAARHGLRFLSEADWHDSRTSRFPEAVVETLRAVTGDDRLRMEQYLDFHRLRRFRQTLLVRGDAPVADGPVAGRIRSLHASAEVAPAADPVDLTPGTEATFHGERGSRLVLRDPLPKAAIAALCAVRPATLPFDGILAAARAAVGRSATDGAAEDAADLEELLLGACGAGFVGLHGHRPRVAAAVPARPEVFPPARLAARESDRVPNLRHETVLLDDALSREILPLVDGTRDGTALLADAARVAVERGLASSGGDPPHDEAEARARLAPLLRAALENLRRVGLLLSP